MHLAAGLLSVDVQDIKLLALLDELSRQAGFAVVPCAACEQRISLQFDRLPLEQALPIILQDQNYLLRWRSAAAARVMPHKLWILPRADAREPARVAATAEPRNARNTGSERQPAASTSAGASASANAVAPLARALANGDAQVRRAAVESLAEIGGADAAAALGLALRDADPRIREAAVNALGDLGGPAAIALLRQARGDAIAFVRQAVVDTLEELQARRR